MAEKNNINQEEENLIENLVNCYSICMDSVRYCLFKEGELGEPPHVRLLLDCADICQITSSSMFPKSHIFIPMYKMCADICDQCALSCDAFPQDEQMKKTAKACWDCSEACRKMIIAIGS